MAQTAELIAVGTELLLGSIANTDAQMISRELSALGINVFYHTVVGDNLERVKAAVETAKGRADLIITTGGLGPTCDDLTKNALAEAFGRELVYDAASASRIRAFFARIGRPMTENNLQQAYLPEGSFILQNDWGTAPGCVFRSNGVTVVMLPGPPRECEAMLRHRVLPYLSPLSDGIIVSRTLKLFGIGEASMEARLRERMNAMENPTLAPYAKEGETELRITAKAETEAKARAMLVPVEAELKKEFGDLIYGVDVASLEERVFELLKSKKRTLSAAESCTGGLVAKRLTDLPGASAVFRGGVVSYTDEVKHRVLGVPQELLDRHGAVSREVAEAMAKGVQALTGSDLAVSVTGVAGPDPDERKNPVGLVYVGLTDGEKTWIYENRAGGSRSRIRTMAAHTALDLVRRYLTGAPIPEDAAGYSPDSPCPYFS